MNALLRIGPDGILLVEAFIVSAIVALLAGWRVSLSRAATVTALVALALALLQAWYDARHPDEAARLTAWGQLVVAAFTIVPSALLLAVSRLRWLTRHAWMLVLVGPVFFVGCFVGICKLSVRAGLV